MADRPIQVGDLVVIMRKAGCCVDLSSGHIFKVSDIRTSNDPYHCARCNTTYPTQLVACGYEHYGIQLWRLKRIPPLEELEGLRTEESLRVPTKERTRA